MSVSVCVYMRCIVWCVYVRCICEMCSHVHMAEGQLIGQHREDTVEVSCGFAEGFRHFNEWH